MASPFIEPQPELRLTLSRVPDDDPDFQKTLSEFLKSVRAQGIEISGRYFALDAVQGGGGLLNDFTVAAEAIKPIIVPVLCAAIGGYFHAKRGGKVTFEMKHLGIKGSAQTVEDAEKILQRLVDASPKLPDDDA